MTFRRIGLAVVVLVAVLWWPHPVRAQDLSGTWLYEVPIRVSNMNGVEHVEQTAQVRLSFTQSGDSVLAHWEMTPPDGSPSPGPRTLRGVLRDGHVTLVDTADAMLRNNDEAPRVVRMVDTIEFTVNGDELVGMRSAYSLDGMVTSVPRAFRAVREGR